MKVKIDSLLLLNFQKCSFFFMLTFSYRKEKTWLLSWFRVPFDDRTLDFSVHLSRGVSSDGIDPV